MKDEIIQFAETSTKLYKHIETLIELEEQKRQALLLNDPATLDSLVFSLQSAIMKLESLEKKRYQAQENAGFSGKTSSQILQMADEETQKILKPIFDELLTNSEKLKILNKSSLELVNMELRFVGQTSQNKNDDKSLYNASGKKGTFSQKGSSFHEKI